MNEFKNTISNRNCCVNGCHSREGRDNDLSFHCFPAKNAGYVTILNKFGIGEKICRRQAWKNALLIVKELKYHMRVCSLHFQRDDFILPGKHLTAYFVNKRNCLKKNAVPTQNLPQRSILPAEELQNIEINYQVSKTPCDINDIKKEEVEYEKLCLEDLHHSIEIKEENDSEKLSRESLTENYSDSNVFECKICEVKDSKCELKQHKGRRSGNTNCCVVGCNSKTSNSPGTAFYSFTVRTHKRAQRDMWIKAVNRQNIDGSPWQPNKYSRICSKHFINNKKCEHPLHPNYVPTIFPSQYLVANKSKKSMEMLINRFNRSTTNKRFVAAGPSNENSTSLSNTIVLKTEILSDINEDGASTGEKETQVDFLEKAETNERKIYFDGNIFICNRLCDGEICEAETQTSFHVS